MPRWPAELRRIALREYLKETKPAIPLHLPHSVPIEYYTQRARRPIGNGYGQATVAAAGTATVTVGPQGLGTVWYPQSWAIATTTGANDNATCQISVGQIGALFLIGAQSYAGGGDSGGLGVPPLTPGTYIVAQWTGGHSGDLATLTVYGDEDVLVA